MSPYEVAHSALAEALKAANHRLEVHDRMHFVRTLGTLRRLSVEDLEAAVVSAPEAALAAMREDPQERELYLGAGGPWCWVTATNGAFRVSIEDAEAMERGGLIQRKWPDYAHWWVLASGA